jgi:hypothetical protein
MTRTWNLFRLATLGIAFPKKSYKPPEEVGLTAS